MESSLRLKRERGGDAAALKRRRLEELQRRFGFLESATPSTSSAALKRPRDSEEAVLKRSRRENTPLLAAAEASAASASASNEENSASFFCGNSGGDLGGEPRPEAAFVLCDDEEDIADAALEAEEGNAEPSVSHCVALVPYCQPPPLFAQLTRGGDGASLGWADFKQRLREGVADPLAALGEANAELSLARRAAQLSSQTWRARGEEEEEQETSPPKTADSAAGLEATDAMVDGDEKLAPLHQTAVFNSRENCAGQEATPEEEADFLARTMSID